MISNGDDGLMVFIGNRVLTHMEELVLLSVDRFMGFDNSGVFIDGEDIPWLLIHAHSAYFVPVVFRILFRLVIKHLVSRHTIELLLFACLAQSRY